MGAGGRATLVLTGEDVDFIRQRTFGDFSLQPFYVAGKTKETKAQVVALFHLEHGEFSRRK